MDTLILTAADFWGFFMMKLDPTTDLGVWAKGFSGFSAAIAVESSSASLVTGWFVPVQD